MQRMKVICKDLRDDSWKQMLRIYAFEEKTLIVNTGHDDGANIIWFVPHGAERYDRMAVSMYQAMRYYDWRAADDE